MSTSTLSERVSQALVEFAWDEWAQMGVFATPRRREFRAQDPEALLVFTFDVARDEPRLFDEVLDWLRVNGPIVNARRLAHLSHGDETVDRLVRAAVAWAAAHGSTLRFAGPPPELSIAPETVSRSGDAPPRTDETFCRYGFLKPPTEPSGKSSAPDLYAPINFAFRLRRLLGVGSRAEIVRFLLTSGVPQATTLAIAEAAVSTKRNVNDALNELASAGAIDRVVLGNEARYSIDRRRWAAFLVLDELEIPGYRDWPSLLRALAEINRWLLSPDVADLSDYLRASEARRLVERIDPLLTRAGITVIDRGHGEEYWSSFEETVDNALAPLNAAPQANVSS